jgi:hypothetical protein
MAEKYNKNWLKNEFGGGSKDYKNGILYQGHGGREYKVRASLDYKGDRAEDYDHKSYTIATKPKKGKNNYDDLVRFIQFIHRQLQEQRNMAPEEIDSTVTEWESTLDVSGFLAA